MYESICIDLLLKYWYMYISNKGYEDVNEHERLSHFTPLDAH